MGSSVIYWHPFVYSIGITLLHFGALKRLKAIVGERKKVFEPACGYGRIKSYLHSSCTYSGIDLNRHFIRHGRRKGRRIRVGNIFNRKAYEESDVVVLCDILHHLSYKDAKNLVSIAKKFAKEKIVVVEPKFVGMASRKRLLSKLVARVFSWIDCDGINRIEKWLSGEEYRELFENLKKSYDFRRMKMQSFGRYYFVEFIL